MNEFEKLYKRDQYLIDRWEKNYSDKEFYLLNKKLRRELELILKKKKLLTPRENFICAIIFHHGFTISSSKKALKFVKKSQEGGYKKQRWLIASIKDRLLQLQGKPQKYGTQIIKLKNGKLKFSQKSVCFNGRMNGV